MHVRPQSFSAYFYFNIFHSCLQDIFFNPLLCSGYQWLSCLISCHVNYTRIFSFKADFPDTGQYKDVRICKTRLRANKIRLSKFSKQAPTWNSSQTTLKSLSGQPNPDPIQRLARKGFGGNGWAMSCGGSFRSYRWDCSHSAFSFVLHFFYHPNLAIETMWNNKI